MQGPLQDSCHQVVTTDSQPLNNYPQHALEVLLREYTEETISKGFIHSFKTPKLSPRSQCKSSPLEHRQF